MQDKKHGAKFIRGVALALMLAAPATISWAQQGAGGPGGGFGGGGGRGGGGRGGPPQPLIVHQLKTNIYWLEGAGGNSAVIIGNNGVIVMDTKTTAGSGAELVADVAKLTPKPITTVILTHSDGDHVNGLLAPFPAGITIIAQENCNTEMQAALNTPAGAALADHMPTRLVTQNVENTTIEGVHLQLLHFAPAHTSGDLMVYLPDDKIMFTGDIVAAQTPYALIHLEKNGSTEGWATTMRGILATDAVTYVPGHGGDVQTKADLEQRLAATTERRDQIKALVAQGKSLDEVRQALNEQPPAARGGGGGGGQGGPGGQGGGQGGPGGAARGGPGGPGGGGGVGRYPNFNDFTAIVVAELNK